MWGSDVRRYSSTAMPPRGPKAKPASFARCNSGRTPMASMTASASSCEPLSKATTILSSPGMNSVTGEPRCRCTPFLRKWSWTKAAISGSSMLESTWSAISTICTSTFARNRLSAISIPMNPPPTTTASFSCPVSSRFFTASTSGIERIVWTRSSFTPGMGGRTGAAPGESTKAS